MGKQCVICESEIPTNRSQYKTCSKACAEIRKKDSWQLSSSGKLGENPVAVRFRTSWLAKPWRLVA